jgi:hypothetical protein
MVAGNVKKQRKLLPGYNGIFPAAGEKHFTGI